MRTLVTAVTAGLVGVFALSGVSSAATAGANQGVTDKSVKIGFIYSKTGVASATSGDSDIGCKARVGRENAAGGVNGRKIEVEYVDDQSSGANMTAAQDLVQNQHVFMVVNDSAFAFLTYQFLLDSGVPLIGGGYDGTYYGAPGNENDHLRRSGTRRRSPASPTTSPPKIMKAHGRDEDGVDRLRHLAVVDRGGEESTASTRFPRSGLEVGLHEHHRRLRQHRRQPASCSASRTRAPTRVLQPMNANTNLAIAQGLMQNGVKMKAELMATGYGQQLLDQPVSATIGPDVLFTQQLGAGRG